jgi:hypothetical protein
MIRQLVNWDKKDYWTKNQQQNYEEAANERFFVLFHTRLFQVQTMASEFNLSLLRIPHGDKPVYQDLALASLPPPLAACSSGKFVVSRAEEEYDLGNSR